MELVFKKIKAQEMTVIWDYEMLIEKLPHSLIKHLIIHKDLKVNKW